MKKHLLSISDLSSQEVGGLIARALALKRERGSSHLADKCLALIFEKPSLRTRVSFEVAMRQLGGYSLYLSQQEVGLGEREPIADVARVLSRYVDGIVLRTFLHSTQEAMAEHASVPVINALSDLEHPCQALSDLLTIYEKKGNLSGITLAFIGDGNNVAHSLLLACSLVGMNFRMASPKGYQPRADARNLAATFSARSGASILLTEDPRAAVQGADVVYTDVWTSMGQEAEQEKRRVAFAGFQVDTHLLALAKGDAILMHDMPAHRGEEVSTEALEGPQSVIFDQAENRLHMQKAILLELLG